MRLLRPRLTIRWLMLAVAVTGLGLGLAARRSEFQSRAHFHRNRAAMMRLRYLRPTHPESTAFHDTLGDKYARAARYPWLPVAPDPPEPE